MLKCDQGLPRHSFLFGALNKMWVYIKGTIEVELVAYDGDGTVHFEL